MINNTAVSVFPIVLFVLIYALSMYYLVDMFSKTLSVIRQKKNNGLEFYRKLVAITIAVTMIDATYVIVTRILHILYPMQDYLLYGAIPIIIKTLVLACIWGFHCIQGGASLCWLSWSYWKDKFKKK